MIKAIHEGIPGWADEPNEQKHILAKYKKYGDQVRLQQHFSFFLRHFQVVLIAFHLQYTPEEADWYGLSLLEATNRIKEEYAEAREAQIVPLKYEFRQKLIEDLKAAGLDKVERVVRTEQGKVVDLAQSE